MTSLRSAPLAAVLLAITSCFLRAEATWPVPAATYFASNEASADEAARNQLLGSIAAALTRGGAEASPATAATEEILKDAAREIHGLLSPILDASPKNEHGRLDDSAARYVLQRLFMERHGWVIKKYDAPVEADASAPSPSSLFNFRADVPTEVRDVFEAHVGGQGSSIVELSAFAATLEYLIKEETPRNIAGVYAAWGLSEDVPLSRNFAESVIDLHMACYISAVSIHRITPAQAFDLQARMTTEYHDWDGSRKFFRGIMDSQAPDMNVLTMHDVVKVALVIESNFVYWNNQQCSSYKEQLVDMEKSPGRVRLLDFYTKALNDTTTTFLESVDYLRQLGALDDVDPDEPFVVMSNYIAGPSNCVARTGYYSVCCMDECADLYGHVERALGKPAARPAEILPVVEGLASASMAQCRRLPSMITRRLEDIAKHNDGLVILHSKEFASWMHLVYPRECTDAELFGQGHYMTVEEWQDDTHIAAQAPVEDMRATVKHLKSVERKANNSGKGNRTASAAAAWSSSDDEATSVWHEMDSLPDSISEDSIPFERLLVWLPPDILAVLSVLAIATKLGLRAASKDLPSEGSKDADAKLTDWDV